MVWGKRRFRWLGLQVTPHYPVFECSLIGALVFLDCCFITRLIYRGRSSNCRAPALHAGGTGIDALLLQLDIFNQLYCFYCNF